MASQLTAPLLEDCCDEQQAPHPSGRAQHMHALLRGFRVAEPRRHQQQAVLDEEHGSSYAAMPQPPAGEQQLAQTQAQPQPLARRRLMRSIEWLLAGLHMVLMLLLVATWSLPAVRANLRSTAGLELQPGGSSCGGRPWLLPALIGGMAALDAICLGCFVLIMMRVWQDCCKHSSTDNKAEAGTGKGGCLDHDEEDWQWDAVRVWPLDWALGAALLLNTLCMAALPLVLVGCD